MEKVQEIVTKKPTFNLFPFEICFKEEISRIFIFQSDVLCEKCVKIQKLCKRIKWSNKNKSVQLRETKSLNVLASKQQTYKNFHFVA